MKYLAVIVTFLSLLSCVSAPPSGRKLSASEIQAHGFLQGQEHLKCEKDAAQTESCRKFVCTNPVVGDFECFDQEASEEDKAEFRRQLGMKVAGAGTDSCQFVERGSQVSCSSSSLDKGVRTRVVCVAQNETKAPQGIRGTCAFEECSGPDLKTCSRKGTLPVLQWKPEAKPQ